MWLNKNQGSEKRGKQIFCGLVKRKQKEKLLGTREKLD